MLASMTALFLTSCSDSAAISAKAIPPKRVVLAVDTSGSAATQKEALCKRASQDFYATNTSDEIVIFRFDSDPAEIYSGSTPSSEEEAAAKLKELLSYSQPKKGTNLLKLVQSVEQVVSEGVMPTEVYIYTDCGFEEMTNAELEACKSVTARWVSEQKEIVVKFVGVRSGFREKLRKLVALPRERVQFLE